MATPEALVKYYDCLKDSFNKIQDKNNKAALINAALRPKICDEFAKSREVLISYLNYIQVFSVIYSERFVNVCTDIIAPLFRENAIDSNNSNNNPDATEGESSKKAIKVHETIATIIELKPALANDFVACIAKAFPPLLGKLDSHEVFRTYLKNCLKVCTYLHGEQLNTLVTRIIEKITPSCFIDDPDEKSRALSLSRKSYEVVYEFLEQLDQPNLRKLTEVILGRFSQDFMSPPWSEELNYLILYLCSSSIEMINLFIDSLWAVLNDANRPICERTASMIFSSSLLARSKIVDLDQVLSQIERTNNWCRIYLDEQADKIAINDGTSENVEAFRAVAISMFYLITQRYREMYEKETIDCLVKLNLDKIIDSPYKPLEFADTELRQRFNEVAALYHIARVTETKMPPSKRRKSELAPNNRLNLVLPYDENPEYMPKRVKVHFRGYYHHRNFTVYRE